MAFEEVTDQVKKASLHAEDYTKSAVEYYKLRTLKASAKGAFSAIQLAIVAFIGMLCLFFLSFGASIWLGEKMESEFIGFFIVGGAYFIILIVSYFFLKKPLEKIVVSKLSRVFYEDSNEVETKTTQAVAKDFTNTKRAI